MVNSDNSKYGKNNFAFFVFLFLFTILAFRMTMPMAYPILWAALFAFSANPLYKRINKLMKNKHENLSSALTMILLVLCVVTPLSAMLASIGKDVADFSISAASTFDIDKTSVFIKNLDKYVMMLPEKISLPILEFLNDTDLITSMLEKFAKWAGKLLTNFSRVFINGISAFVFDLIIMMMTSFFLIRDGEKLVNYIKKVTPLSEEERSCFYRRAKSLTNSVIYGILFTVAIQALLGGIGWHYAGLPNASLFGLLMFFFGLFPAGTAAVWVPGSIFLMLTGHGREGVLLFIWGAAIVGTIDNLLRPFLISGSDKSNGEVNTLLIILGLFGGVMSWGFIGIFLGPLVLVLFTIIFDLYARRCNS